MRSLSGGMKRRVLVAQALVHKPPVIVLDEPTAGVDVELRQGLWQFIRELNRDGHTIVLTTHYLEEAEPLCHRIAMLRRAEWWRSIHPDLLKRRACICSASGCGSPANCGSWQSIRSAAARAPAAASGLCDVEPTLAASANRAARRGDGTGKPDLEDVFVEMMTTLVERLHVGFPPCCTRKSCASGKSRADHRGAHAHRAALSADLQPCAGSRVQVYRRGPYTAFLVPGLVMMSLLQNAFANSSSSLIQSKITGNIIFVLLPPLRTGVLRRLCARGGDPWPGGGRGVLIVTPRFGGITFLTRCGSWPSPAGSAVLGALGMIAGIWAEKFDQLAAFQNFLIMPLTFLSGVFYSIHSLPPSGSGLAFQPVFLHD